MFLKTKYICGEIDGHMTAVPFLEVFEHAMMARRLCMEVKSAGFVTIGLNCEGKLDIVPHGRSISLGVGSNPEVDRKLLSRALSIELTETEPA